MLPSFTLKVNLKFKANFSNSLLMNFKISIFKHLVWIHKGVKRRVKVQKLASLADVLMAQPQYETKTLDLILTQVKRNL